MRLESEGKGGMKVAKEVIEEEDMTVPAEESGEGEEQEERRERVTEWRGKREAAHLMMAARTLQRLLVGKAEGSHTRERRELVDLGEEGGGRPHPL